MTNLNSIDYTPLRNMKFAIPVTFIKGFTNKIGLIANGIFVLIIAGSILLAGENTPDWIITMGIVYIVFIVGLAVLYKNKVWEDFAKVNGWHIGMSTEHSFVPPSIDYGHNLQTSPIVEANLANIVFTMFSFSCQTGEGRYKFTHHFMLARHDHTYYRSSHTTSKQARACGSA